MKAYREPPEDDREIKLSTEKAKLIYEQAVKKIEDNKKAEKIEKQKKEQFENNKYREFVSENGYLIENAIKEMLNKGNKSMQIYFNQIFDTEEYPNLDYEYLYPAVRDTLSKLDWNVKWVGTCSLLDLSFKTEEVKQPLIGRFFNRLEEIGGTDQFRLIFTLIALLSFIINLYLFMR